MNLKRGIAAILNRKRLGYPKVIIFDTQDQGEAEAIMAQLDLGDYHLEFRDFTPTDVSEEDNKQMNKNTPLKIGHLVQLNPETVKNKMFAACIMVVTEVKSWGAQGYVQALGEDGKPGGQAYYRATFAEMELVGCVEWTVGGEE